MTTPRIEASAKRVRVMLDGRFVADCSAPLLVWERPNFPTYYFPMASVDPAVAAGDAAYTHPAAELAGHVALRWPAFDHWLEEDEEVFVHPRDPYKRVDILRSTRHVVVSVEGTVVADSQRPTLLFETSLPRRHYLPLTDVRMDLLRPSPTRTRCPYKGEAVYWSVQRPDGSGVLQDLVWSYPSPVRESAPIAGLLCFYDEHVDVTVDGEPQPRPVTAFS